MPDMRIRIEGLRKEYEGKTVLAAAGVTIRPGALCGIIGPNGAGKSTLLSIVAGLEEPTAGRVLYGEEASPQIPRRDMTMVFQSPYLLRTTVEKNIAYPLKRRGWTTDAIEQRVGELVVELGLEKQRKQKAWTLSAGEGQKTALARALAFRPRLLLLDEPTANIDPSTTEELERLLRRINRDEGTTILIVTHNLPQARRLCNEILFISDGTVREQGESETLLLHPRHAATRSFIQGVSLI